MAREAHERQEIGERLRELRGPLGNGQYKIKQHEVASFVGVTVRAYQAWEGGANEITWENAQKLAAFFKTDVQLILHGGAQTQLDRIEAMVRELLALARPSTSPVSDDDRAAVEGLDEIPNDPGDSPNASVDAPSDRRTA